MAKRKEKYAVTINGYKYYRCMVNGEVILEKTLEAMEQKRERLIRTKERIGSNYTDITIGQYSKDWYIEKAQDITDGASRPYAYAVDWIVSSIGKYKLIDSTPEMLEQCVKRFAKTKLANVNNYPSQKYIDDVIAVLKMIYKKAKKELIFPNNYAEGIQVKSISTRKNTGHRTLSMEEQKRIIEFDHPFRPYLCFQILCGLMPSEACALQWKNIVFDEEKQLYKLKVQNTVELRSNKKSILRIDTTKNSYRKREIYIPVILNEWIDTEKPKHKGNDFLFTNKNGELLSASSLRGKLKSYLLDMDIYYNNKKNKYDPTRTAKDKELSIKKFTQYDLRHTYATNLAMLGTPSDITAALMGHADIRTTQKYYIDKTKLPTDEAVKRLGNKLSKI
ncbi:MAG: site-specific integrase [Oscillospiraceae bacterium]|nr:site-specific integrase [Oscillospiraceae bacterium]